MSGIKVIEGGIFIDHRGKITHVNFLDMSEVKRFYVIHHDNAGAIRAWHGINLKRNGFIVSKVLLLQYL